MGGLLQVEAFEKLMGDGTKKSLTITRKNQNIAKDELERIIDEFKQFEADDLELIKRNTARNNLESSVFALKQKIYDKEKQEMKLMNMKEEHYEQLMEIIDDLNQWLDDNADIAEYDDFIEKQQEFDQVVQAIFNNGNDYDDNH